MNKIILYGPAVILAVVVALISYSQIILPLIRKTPVFPFFRRRPVIEREEEALNEEQREAEARAKLAKRREEMQGHQN